MRSSSSDTFTNTIEICSAVLLVWLLATGHSAVPYLLPHHDSR